MTAIDRSVLQALSKIAALPLQTDVSMAQMSSWRVGGKAKVLVQPSSIEEIIALRKYITEQKLPNLVIGNTTNLLFTDDCIDAIILKIGKTFSLIEQNNHIIVAQSGTWVPQLARTALQAGLTGIEHTCGIPGTLGGLVVMNGGSQRKGIGDSIMYVKTVDVDGKAKIYSKDQCEFSYRSSIFQSLGEVIIEVGLQLKPSQNKKQMHT